MAQGSTKGSTKGSSKGSTKGSTGESNGGAGSIQLASAEGQPSAQPSGQQSGDAAGLQGSNMASGLSFSDVPLGAASGRGGAIGEESNAAPEEDRAFAAGQGAGRGLQEESGLAQDIATVIAELFAIEPAAGGEAGGPETVAYRSAIVTETAELPRGNAAPIASDDHYRILQGASLFVPAGQGALLNDRDPDGDALTAVLESDGVLPRALYFHRDGTLVVAAGQVPGSLQIRYRAFDGALYSELATITIEVVER